MISPFLSPRSGLMEERRFNLCLCVGAPEDGSRMPSYAESAGVATCTGGNSSPSYRVLFIARWNRSAAWQ